MPPDITVCVPGTVVCAAIRRDIRDQCVGLRRARRAQVDAEEGAIRDHLARIARLDDADIDEDAALHVGQRFEGEDLVRRLDDGARAEWPRGRVRRRPMNLEGDRPDHAAPCDQPAVIPRRLHDERPVGLPRLLLDPLAARAGCPVPHRRS